MKKSNNQIKNKNKGKTFTGQVISDKMAKTIVVELEYKRRHPVYKKIISRHKKIYVHNTIKAKPGQKVLVQETHPLSKLKRFVTLKIL